MEPGAVVTLGPWSLALHLFCLPGTRLVHCLFNDLTQGTLVWLQIRVNLISRAPLFAYCLSGASLVGSSPLWELSNVSAYPASKLGASR